MLTDSAEICESEGHPPREIRNRVGIPVHNMGKMSERKLLKNANGHIAYCFSLWEELLMGKTCPK
ncbi:hypothetical protein CW304_11900 [Bacillus sp. UFRGS-B20]|nr:hypothetical protein CW304_11900 [Bacillus sp. UFRGS-B20]